ncbi:MAG TPA: hypothetical protein ENK36_01765 [Desulfobacterales bacterium]|nr:hypothetical protein [Desulfobacterales bacterium]
MLKKIMAVLMTLFFSLGLTTAVAKTQGQKSVKKWNPETKPATKQTFYDEKGNTVDIKNVSKIKDKTLYDKKGNAYELKNGKMLQLGKEKQLQKRIGPGPVA